MDKVSKKTVAHNPNDSDADIVLMPDSSDAHWHPEEVVGLVDTGSTEPCPDWATRQARAFGRRGNQRAFEKWLCGQTSDANTWTRLRSEFERARNEQEPLESWRKVFREGIVPQVSVAGLQNLAQALERDDPRLLQGVTSNPPALACMANDPVEGCCAWCFLLLDHKRPYQVSVGALDQRFAESCFKASQLCGEAGSARYFLNFLDETPRDEMRKLLLVEVLAALVGRQSQPEEQTPLATLLRRSIEAVKNGPAK
jgi:hypothetical protein